MGFFKKEDKRQAKQQEQNTNQEQNTTQEQMEDSPPQLPKFPSVPNYQTQPPQQTQEQEVYEEENNPQRAIVPQPREQPSLPSIPNSNMGNQMNQNIIKDAVSQEQQESSIPQPPQQTPPLRQTPPQMPNNMLTQEQRQPLHYEETSRNTSPTRTVEMSGAMTQSTPQPPRPKRTGPLFIQLDKFEKTISTFDEMKLKISEIESLLKTIKETKAKEDEKIEHWEKEIESIKNNLDEIDKNIFSQV